MFILIISINLKDHIMHKYKDIQDFFKVHLKHLKIDKKLIKDLKNFRYHFMNKNDETIAFLGSNLLGVHKIIFSNLDDDKLMNEVLKIKDYKELIDEIYKVPGLIIVNSGNKKTKLKVAGNLIYQTLMYISNRIINNKHLSTGDKEAGLKETCLIIEYKMFTSLYFKYFPYQTAEIVATTVYNNLSHKYLIKQLDNWQELFLYRYKHCIDKKTVTYTYLKKYDTKSSIAVISGVQTKLRNNVKEIYKELIKVLENGDVFQVEKSTYIGGENDLKQVSDKTVGTNLYITNMVGIMQQPNELIDLEIVTIVKNLFKNITDEDITGFLRDITDDKFIKQNELKYLVENILTISFSFLQKSNINIEQREYIPKALVNIRFYWASSKVKNEEMIKIKDIIHKLAYKSTGRKTNWFLITLTLTFILYVFLRSIRK